MDPSLIQVSRIVYEERLQEAEKARQRRRWAVDRPGWAGNLRLKLGDVLIEAGQKLKAHQHPVANRPIRPSGVKG